MATYVEHMNTLADGMPDGPIKAGIRGIVELHETINSETRKLSANRDLTPEGKAKEARSSLGKHAHKLIRAERLVAGALARNDEKRAFEMPVFDKTDAFTAAMHVEARGRIHAKSLAEKQVALMTASLPVLQAVLAAPNELTGISDEMRQLATARATELVHPGKLAKLDEQRDAINLLGSALDYCRNTAREFANLPSLRALDELVNQAVPDQRSLMADVNRAVEVT